MFSPLTQPSLVLNKAPCPDPRPAFPIGELEASSWSYQRGVWWYASQLVVAYSQPNANPLALGRFALLYSNYSPVRVFLRPTCWYPKIQMLNPKCVGTLHALCPTRVPTSDNGIWLCCATFTLGSHWAC